MNPNHHNPKPQDDFSDIWDLAKNYTPSEEAQNDASWEKFQKKLTPKVKKTPTHTLSITYRRILSYAAVIALFLLSGYMYFLPEVPAEIAKVTENTTSGQAREIKLPDGSTVMLSANSELSYSFTEAKRFIELKGHARFEVARNESAPFTVNTPSTTITVLGTGFDVDAYPNSNVKVFVNHGKVKVENQSQEAILTQNQGVISQNNELVSWNHKQNPLEVHNQYLKFDNAPLDFVLETLNHTQNMQFQVPANASELHFTGTLKFNQTSEEIAALLQAALQTPIQIAK
jgi:transmembrane sensor